MTEEFCNARTIRPAPVRKTIYVAVPPERAFEVFVYHIERWWPKSHKVGAADLARPVIEPHAGGRWYELGVDKSECEVGKVATWDPPNRLVLIWQITGEWTFDRDLETEVEVLFIAQGSGTRVELEHRDLEKLGASAQTARQAIDSPEGWSGLLALFSKEASASD